MVPSHLPIDQASLRYLPPSSANFRPHTDEDGLSVYRRAGLESIGLGAEDVARAGKGPAVVAGLQDVHLLAQGLEIADDPMPVPPDVSPAHALVTGWHSMTDGESRRVARALAKLATCVYPDSDWHVAASLVKARAEQA
jgi:hypothetical protein